MYELTDGTQVNAIFQPDGLQSFATEYKRCHLGRLEGQAIRILPLNRVITSKRAAAREKDWVALPILERTLRLKRRLNATKQGPKK